MAEHKVSRIAGVTAAVTRTVIGIAIAESPLTRHAPKDIRERLRSDAADRYRRACEDQEVLPSEEEERSRRVVKNLLGVLKMS